MIDAHCHVSDLPRDAINTLRDSRVVVVGATRGVGEFEKLRRLFAHADWLRPAVGLHPATISAYPSQELQRFRDALAQTSYVVEVGLDGSSRATSSLPIQRRVFAQVLEWCAGAKFVSVHARRAEAEALSVVNAYGHPVAFHWFSGRETTLRQIIERGHVLSVNAAMLRSARIKKLIASVPMTQMVVESDAPFATGTDSIVKSIHHVYAFLATTWSMPITDVVHQVQSNIVRLTRQS